MAIVTEDTVLRGLYLGHKLGVDPGCANIGYAGFTGLESPSPSTFAHPNVFIKESLYFQAIFYHSSNIFVRVSSSLMYPDMAINDNTTF
jgi:hypothetical protein